MNHRPARGAGPFSRLEWMIAGRYLRARRREGVISVIAGFSLVGILLGVGTLIVVMSVMNGFRIELVNSILGSQPHIIVLPVRSEGLGDFDAISERVAGAPGVLQAAPFVEGQVMASSPAANAGALIRGMRLADIQRLDRVANPEESEGDLSRLAEGVAVGAGLARTLQLSVGDEITLISPRGLTTPFGVQPRIKSYPIVNIFRIGVSEYDKVFVFMPLAEAQAYFRKQGLATGIQVTVDQPQQVEAVGTGIEPLVAGEGYLWNWQRSNGAFLAALRTEANVMFFILSLIFLIVALNITSSLIMLVKDKGSAIGILRTMGLTRGAILRVFFICGASIGVVGTVLGVVAGVLFVTFIHEIQAVVEWVTGTELWDPEIRFLTRLPAVLQWDDVFWACTVALGFSFLATWYPARRAARLDPVEALRYE
ncbi:MAG: lipoprotein-releasing ABC transporter permease subunit [Pseudomonadota bacterium]